MTALSLTGWAFVLCGLAGWLTGRLRNHHFDAFFALSYVPYWIRHVLEHNQLLAVVDAAGFAWFAWCWWTGGGGDGTKRRLRRLARRFRPIRRTAPVGA